MKATLKYNNKRIAEEDENDTKLAEL